MKNKIRPTSWEDFILENRMQTITQPKNSKLSGMYNEEYLETIVHIIHQYHTIKGTSMIDAKIIIDNKLKSWYKNDEFVVFYNLVEDVRIHADEYYERRGPVTRSNPRTFVSTIVRELSDFLYKEYGYFHES